MVPSVLKAALVPGTTLFFLLGATLGSLLLYRKKDNGRAGRLLLTGLVAFYWILSTPASAVAIVRLFSPDYPPVQSVADARGATAIVVLGGGMDTYRSRGATLLSGGREHSLRALEAARIYQLLDRPLVITTGSLAPVPLTEAALMAQSLVLLGVPEEQILREEQSRNTHDHTVYVPQLMRARGIKQFVLVTSRQHMARSLRAFRAAGYDPVPSSPEFFAGPADMRSPFIPTKPALDASSAMLYDLMAMAYYWARGWV